MILPFTVHLQRNTRLFLLSSAAALFTSLALNAAKSSILFSSIKRPPKAWWSAEVKDVRLLLPLTEAIKIARLTSPLSDVLRLSSPRPRLRHGRRLALLFRPNQTLNLCTLLLRSIAGSPSSPNFPNCSSSKSWLRSMPLYLRSYFSVSQPKSLASHVPRGFSLLSFALPVSFPLNFCGCL